MTWLDSGSQRSKVERSRQALATASTSSLLQKNSHFRNGELWYKRSSPTLRRQFWIFQNSATQLLHFSLVQPITACVRGPVSITTFSHTERMTTLCTDLLIGISFNTRERQRWHEVNIPLSFQVTTYVVLSALLVNSTGRPDVAKNRTNTDSPISR